MVGAVAVCTDSPCGLSALAIREKGKLSYQSKKAEKIQSKRYPAMAALSVCLWYLFIEMKMTHPEGRNIRKLENVAGNEN